MNDIGFAEQKKRITDPFDKALASLDDIKDAANLSDRPLSLVDSWINTGSYALNAIISGSLHGGVPKGRISCFSGPSGCGKTLIMMKIASNFLAEALDNRVVVFDSEVAVDRATAEALGADPARIKHVPVNTVMEVRNVCSKFLDSIIEYGLEGKFLILVDSMGNLAATKELDDAAKDKDASDMGLRAKQLKSLFRVLTYRAASSKTTILFSNHVYSDPAVMYPSAVKNQSGGEGPVYMSSLVVQLGFKRQQNKDDYEQEEILLQAKKVGGIVMHALTIKNRFIPPMLECDVYNNFKTGLDKYSGLFEMAKNLEVIEGTKTYTCGEHNLGFRKKFEKDPDVWEKIIIPILEPIVNNEFKFSQETKNKE